MYTLNENEMVTTLYKRDNNLDQKDNLDTLPEKKAVYGLFGRMQMSPANCRFIGVAQNLRAAVKLHYNDAESDKSLLEFMRSIKIKQIVYLELKEGEDADAIASSWRERFKPECNAELNKVY